MNKEYHAVLADEVIGKLPGERQAKINARAIELIVIEKRASFATADLTEAEINAIDSATMDARHDHLNQLLDDK